MQVMAHMHSLLNAVRNGRLEWCTVPCDAPRTSISSAPELDTNDEIGRPRRHSGKRPVSFVNFAQASIMFGFSLSTVINTLGQLDFRSDSSIVIADECSNEILHATGSPIASRKGRQIVRKA